MERTAGSISIAWYPQTAGTATPTAPEATPSVAAAVVPAKRRRGRPRIESREQLLGQPVRMSILSALAQAGSLSFMRLREIIRTNDGNLSIHARKLERAGYVRVEKKFAGRVPRTEYIITEQGQHALDEYTPPAR
jgi:DNA-binding MarR family transcriptional regulator